MASTWQRAWVSPRLISLDKGTQSRIATCNKTIRSYTEAMESGLWIWEREPLPLLFYDGTNYYPGDGHHRIAAAAIATGVQKIYCEIRPGTVRDALFHSCGANRYHGLPRRIKDKQRQVELLLRDPDWGKMSDRAIAEHCAVSPPFVGKMRTRLAKAGAIQALPQRIGKSGHLINTANIGRLAATRIAITPSSGPSLPLDEKEQQITLYNKLESLAQEFGGMNRVAFSAIDALDIDGLKEIYFSLKADLEELGKQG